MRFPDRALRLSKLPVKFGRPHRFLYFGKGTDPVYCPRYVGCAVKEPAAADVIGPLDYFSLLFGRCCIFAYRHIWTIQQLIFEVFLG